MFSSRFYDVLLFEFESLKKKHASNILELKHLPRGRLYKVKGQNKYYHLYSKSSKGEKISVKKGITFNEKAKKDLARKAYLLAENKYILDAIKTLSVVINEFTVSDTVTRIESLPQSYKNLPLAFFACDSKEYSNWGNEDFIQYSNYGENKIHNTKKGDVVRSKSERDIANFLYSQGILYRYECQLVMDGQIYYPDFTIYNPETKRTIYWEHLGLMDDLEYRAKNMKKIETYINSGVATPWDNLIISYECDTTTQKRLAELLMARY